jgi:hypothetical protein
MISTGLPVCLAGRFEAVALIRRDLRWRTHEMISALVIDVRDSTV